MGKGSRRKRERGVNKLLRHSHHRLAFWRSIRVQRRGQRKGGRFLKEEGRMKEEGKGEKDQNVGKGKKGEEKKVLFESSFSFGSIETKGGKENK